MCSRCFLCEDAAEDSEHLFLHCWYARKHGACLPMLWHKAGDCKQYGEQFYRLEELEDKEAH